MNSQLPKRNMDGIRSGRILPAHQKPSPLIIVPHTHGAVPAQVEQPVVRSVVLPNAPVVFSGWRSVHVSYWERWRHGRLAGWYIRIRSTKSSNPFRLFFQLSPRSAFYVALAGGVAFGVFLTSVSFMVFDRGVSASAVSAEMPVTNAVSPPVADLGTHSGDSVSTDDVFLEYFNEEAEEEYRAKITDMVKGYPIEPMLPYIFTKDRTVAAFLIGIAKKESNWGKRVPVLDNQDCFNYWGYRGVRRLMGTGGHTCFNSRKDAVDTVAKRIETLVYSQKLDTPEKMVLWKCGFSCQGQNRESVKKWISDVSLYFSQFDGNDTE